MEITTKLPSPARAKSLTLSIILKLCMIALAFRFIAIKMAYRLNYSDMDRAHGMERDHTIQITEPKILLAGETVSVIFHDTLPRVVASMLTLHVGICCGYAGLLHLKLIVPK